MKHNTALLLLVLALFIQPFHSDALFNFGRRNQPKTAQEQLTADLEEKYENSDGRDLPPVDGKDVGEDSEVATYGVDFSFPIHHYLDGTTHHAERYDQMMKGCYEKYTRFECDGNEKDRIAMNLDQPRSQWNYTEIGFKKLKAPVAAWEPLQQFYRENRERDHLEQWPRGNTYVNHWVSPTYMISLEDTSLRGGGNMGEVKRKIWDGVKPVIEKWVGREVEPTSLYGIRIYKDGAILSTHVDRLPLVSSCIIQVDQDVDEPWPVEVYSHDGKAYNVTMEPGDMVLYESHTVLHGRPFPLKGRHYANVFVHFQPVEHEFSNLKLKAHPEKAKANKAKGTARSATGAKFAGHEQDNHERKVEDEKSERFAKKGERETVDEGQSIAHIAAFHGKIDILEKILVRTPQMVHSVDNNLWQPLHEAARGGNIEAVRLLVDHGADLGAKTSNGGTALWWARRSLPAGHSVIEYLESIGAPEEGDL